MSTRGWQKIVQNSQINHEVVSILPGEEVFIKREQSVVAKNTHLDWVGPFKVLDANDTLVFIQKSEKLTDFVHRTQVVNKVHRFKKLEPIIVLPPNKIVEGVAAESGGSLERFENLENAAPKQSTRIRTKPKRYGFDNE